MKHNGLKETLATLPAHVSSGIDGILVAARSNFDRGEQCIPHAFAIPTGGEHFGVIQIAGKFDDETKPHVWAMVRQLRLTCPTVAFINEVWESNPGPGDKNYDPVTKRCKVMPRDDPNRTESIMLYLWQGSRLVTFRAGITRNPDKLGEWEAVFDSFFPVSKGADRAEGAMVDGQSYAGEGN